MLFQSKLKSSFVNFHFIFISFVSITLVIEYIHFFELKFSVTDIILVIEIKNIVISEM